MVGTNVTYALVRYALPLLIIVGLAWFVFAPLMGWWGILAVVFATPFVQEFCDMLSEKLP